MPDVYLQQSPVWPVRMNRACDKGLPYIREVDNERDMYFFANSTDNPVDTKVVLRGRKNVALWNPHTGERSPAELTVSEGGGQPVTTVRLALSAVTSMFFVEE